jgi:hypothetical protein
MDEDICKELLGKTYVEVKTEESLRRRLSRCLHKKIFNIDGIFFSYADDSITITLPSEFFTEPFFILGGTPSDTKIRKFYDSMINLQRRLELDFHVDRNEKPSSTNLSMKIKFDLRNLQKTGKMTIQDLLNHLEPIWSRIAYELHLIGYRI